MTIALDRARLRRGAALSFRALAGALGLGFAVVGIELVGLALAVFLQALGMVDLGMEANVGEQLGAGLILAVVGWFFLGTAWEGLLGWAPEEGAWSRDELAVAWLAAVLVSGTALVVAGGEAAAYGSRLWPGIFSGALLVWSVGWAGLSAVPMVVAVLWGLDRIWPGIRWEAGRLPGTLAVWAIAAASVFQQSGGLS
ncbi:MAG: hypothetical protein ACRDXD_05670 [Acidimicrobiia bacterium]